MSVALRVGVVGAGFIGRTHLAALAAEGVSTTLVDVDPGMAALVAGDHGAEVCRTLDELLERVDVVDICTPTHRHAEIAIRAAAAGRHVICEKPLARTLEDASAIIAACERAGVRLFVAQVVRFFPEYVAAKQAVAADAIGSVAVMRLKRATFRPRRAARPLALRRREVGRHRGRPDDPRL